MPSLRRCRISDQWSYCSIPTLILENEFLRIVVLVGKGSDIIEFRYKPIDVNFLLTLPTPIRHPAQHIPSAYTSESFLDYFTGGWNEVLPNGGPSVTYKGALLGQHGEISLIPWQHAILEDNEQRVSARLWVRALRTPFLVEKTLTLEAGLPVLSIEEMVTNEAGEAMHLMWGQHIAFGRPFLDEGAVFDVPARRLIAHPAMSGYEPRRFQPGTEGVWPQIAAPDATMVDASQVPAFGSTQVQEMAYLTELSDGWYAITNPVLKTGFGLRFDPKLYRYLWYWQQLGNVAQGYPWWGRLHTTALEPWTSYPTNGLLEAIENGTALVMQPGETIQTTLRATAYHGMTRVAAIDAVGTVRGA